MRKEMQTRYKAMRMKEMINNKDKIGNRKTINKIF